MESWGRTREVEKPKAGKVTPAAAEPAGERFYVLTWEYHDKSSWGVVRVYTERQRVRAEDDLALLKEHETGKNWKLHPMLPVPDAS